MAYTFVCKIGISPSATGITDWRATVIDTAGGTVASAVSSGFVEIGGGAYLWTYASMPDAQRGAVKFYQAADPSTILASAEITPEEHENADVKTSTRSTLTAANVWDAATSGLTTAGSIGKLLVDNIDTALSGLSTLTAAGVWSYGTRTLTSFGSLAASIWSYTTRTLTQDAGSLTSAIAGGDITITRAVTFDGIEIPDLTIPGTWTSCYFTVKESLRDADSAALIQIVVSNPGAGTDGLKYLNGAAATAAQGALVVGGSSVTITIHDDATAELEDAQDLSYDVKFLLSSGKSQLATQGAATIALTATRTI